MKLTVKSSRCKRLLGTVFVISPRGFSRRYVPIMFKQTFPNLLGNDLNKEQISIKKGHKRLSPKPLFILLQILTRPVLLCRYPQCLLLCHKCFSLILLISALRYFGTQILGDLSSNCFEHFSPCQQFWKLWGRRTSWQEAMAYTENQIIIKKATKVYLNSSFFLL